MWECFNCDFQNVDAAPICAKCRAPKPEPGAKRMGRNFYASQVAARERAADEVMHAKIPTAPTSKRIRDKWIEAGADTRLADQLVLVERRQYALREALRQMVNVARAPQSKGNDAVLVGVIQTLIDWESEL